MKKIPNKLLRGYRSFQQKRFKDYSSLFEVLTSSQQPKVMIIACCDSRIDPAILLQADPGDLFVARTIAAVVPEKDNLTGLSVHAALEFAIKGLCVENLILLGHSDCGGAKVLLNNDGTYDHVHNWMSQINIDVQKNDTLDNVTKKIILQSYYNCLSIDFVKSKVGQDKLTIHQWYFDIKKGQLFVCDDGQYHDL